MTAVLVETDATRSPALAHVNVTIAGKTYRMACGEGEEAHLEGLAAGLDARVGEMRETFGEIGDMRLHVMAALMVSDELAETKRRLQGLEAQTAELRARLAHIDAERLAEAERVGAGIDAAAQRIASLADRLSASSRGR